MLIEDCAQAIGAHVDDAGRQVGTVGELGAFSFFSKKQLCVGEGGMVTTRRRAARRARAAAALARDDEQHLGPPPRPRPRLRRGRHRLQLPPGRAPRGARAEPAGAPEREHRRAARDRARLPRAARRGPRASSCRFDEQAVERSSHFAFPVLLAGPRRRAIASATSSKRTASRRLGIRRCTRSPSTAASRPPDGLPSATEAADRHCALPLSSTMDEARRRDRRRGRARGAP